ncbi:DsbA family protein [Aeromicrobium sp. CTD01-1L150]|uniref:DsbA family oxidoreductase n=1 Tax=Aeromicrobium sp. CTD01-1L150 TaxID=3341830 RepID=UPI0035C2544B
MQVSVFCDVTDAWSYIGVTRLNRAAATFTLITGEPVISSLRASQLSPDEPNDGQPLMDALADELGGRDRAEKHVEQVVAAAKITGLDIDVTDAVRANSFDAWRLLSWALEQGPGPQQDLAQQLWRAHFLEGADVGDPLVLASRAALAGLDLEAADAVLEGDDYADAVRTQDETARSLGIKQHPLVVVESRWTLAGLQSQDDYVRGLQQMYAQWRDELGS